MRQTAVLLNDLLKFESPADARLSEFFRQHRELGTKDRAWVAETAYGVLRRYRYLREVSISEADEQEDTRKLIIAWMLKIEGKSIRDLDDMLDERQKRMGGHHQSQKQRGLCPSRAGRCARLVLVQAGGAIW